MRAFCRGRIRICNQTYKAEMCGMQPQQAVIIVPSIQTLLEQQPADRGSCKAVLGVHPCVTVMHSDCTCSDQCAPMQDQDADQPRDGGGDTAVEDAPEAK